MDGSGTGQALLGSHLDGRVAALPARFRFRPGTRLVVHGPDVDRLHPVRLGALRRGIPQSTASAWLGGLMRGRHGIVVAGGREAAAAAAMTAFVLERAGHDPSVVLGDACSQLGGRIRDGGGPHAVAHWRGGPSGLTELAPKLAVLLGIGGCPWRDRGAWSSAFLDASAALPGDTVRVALGDPRRLDRPAAGAVDWCSLHRGGDWWGGDLREDSGRFRFRIFHRGRYVIEVRLRVFGLRNVVGALATAAACERLGVPASAVREGLEEFAGLAGDFERRGSFRGVTLIEDAAEDTGSVRQVLTTARRAFAGRRLWAVHDAGSTGPSSAGLAPALAVADRVLVVNDDGGTTEALAGGGVWAVAAPTWGDAVSELDRHLEPGDVLVTLGAGALGTIADAFIRRLPRDRQAG